MILLFILLQINIPQGEVYINSLHLSGETVVLKGDTKLTIEKLGGSGVFVFDVSKEYKNKPKMFIKNCEKVELISISEHIETTGLETCNFDYTCVEN